MANKQNVMLSSINKNLCEINKEYPSLKSSSIERHLCTNTTPSKIAGSINISQLLNSITTETQHKDSNRDAKHSRQQTEVIELFEYQQQEEINNKLYRKCRYKLSNSDNENEEEEKRDNTS